MEMNIAKSSLLNTYVAGDIVNSGGIITIPGLMPLPTAEFIEVVEVDPQVEKVQIAQIGSTTPVVTASTKYAFLIGNTAPRREGYQQSMNTISYTSPAVLTGNPVTDRVNLYTALAYKVNNIPTIQAHAYLVITATQTNATPFVFGEIVTENASGATGVVISGTTGTLTIYVTSGTWTGASGTITGNLGGATTSAVHTITTGIGMAIVDNSDYFNAKGTRYGANAIILTKGFASTDLTIRQAAQYQFGQGTRMLQDIPVKELLSDNLASGQWSFNVQNPPIAGATYACFTLKWTRKVDGDIGAMPLANQQLFQNLWLQKTTDGSTPNANYAATRTAILAL